MKEKREAPMSPSLMIAIGFALLILLVTLLLMLPISSQSRTVTPPLTALFTATSAVCVTGQVPVSYTHLRRSLMISGVGAADYELRKRNLALLTVHGPMRPQGAQAWGQIRNSGLFSVRPVEILRALWGEGECDVQSMVMPCDGAVPGVTHGRFVEGPAHVAKDGPVGQPVELPIELEDVMEQLSLVNRLYAEAAATGSRNTLREALEIDPALTGIDLLYAESVVADMLENQKEKYPRFFKE